MNGPDPSSRRDPALSAAGPATSNGKTSAATTVCSLLVLVGAVALFLGIRSDPLRAWRIYLVNFLFFTGIGAGGILFVCALNMASGTWGRNVRRVAEGLGLFLPVSLVLLLSLIPGLKTILPWVQNPYGPSWWLDLDFLVRRNLAGLAALSLLGTYILYLSLRSDFGCAADKGLRMPAGPLQRFFTKGWKGTEREWPRARTRLGLVSPIYAIAFAVVLTVIGVDLIMSLKSQWYSTLIGAYYFMGSFYSSLAALLVAVIWTRRRFHLYEAIQPRHLHDIAKLAMAFGIVTGDFFYTQLFVIWYGNLPVETTFLIDRMHDTPWRIVSILVLLLCFVLPLVAMLRQSLKNRGGPMLAFGTAVLVAMWMERFLLVGPSLTGTASIVFGLTEVFVTLGFLGLMGLTFISFISRVPPVALGDPILDTIGETR